LIHAGRPAFGVWPGASVWNFCTRAVFFRDLAPSPAPARDNRAMAKPIPKLSPQQIQQVIATAFEDRPPYNRVLMEHGISQGALVQLLKRELTSAAYKLWVSKGKAVKPATVKSTWPHGR